MRLSIDPSLSFRPDLAGSPRPAARVQQHAEPAPAFARELEHASRGAGAGPSTLVRAARTPLTTDEAASALSAAWEKAAGQPPSAQTLSILVGQWAHETGRGASMLNYNFGGIKGTGPSGMSAVYKTREGWGETEVRISDRFRAYASAEEGAADYVGLLSRRYPDAVRAATHGDAAGFVQALKARGYFTGNEAEYVQSVSSLAKQALATGFGGFAPGAAGASAVASLGSSLASAAPIPAALQPTQASFAAAPSQTPVRPALAAESGSSEPPPLGATHWELASFTDEVNRAALLMSALNIGRSDDGPGEERRG